VIEILQFLLIFGQIAAFIVLDPLFDPVYIPVTVDLNAARDIPLQYGGDSILLHLPKKSG